MPKLTVLPHATLCPAGAAFEAPSGETRRIVYFDTELRSQKWEPIPCR